MQQIDLATIETLLTAHVSDFLPDKNKLKPRFTGKRIVTMRSDMKPAESIKKFDKRGSMKIASIRDFSTDSSQYLEAFSQGDGIFFDKFNVAVVNSKNDDKVGFMINNTSGSPEIISTEPERFVYACPTKKAVAKKKKSGKKDIEEQYTWGAQALKLQLSKLNGKGINIAVLDTGLNLSHPDFAGIKVTSKSFIRNQTVEDKNGHGTHCSGIAVGALDKKSLLRYGVASHANLFIGKVLSNAGSGSDSGILAAIEWALQNKCQVISMSLGSEVGVGETYSPAYERVAKTALRNKCLIVAAAGNESERPYGLIKPVGHPANCPSIMAVAAIDNKFEVAPFSCGGLNDDGGQIDIAAPGVNILSSWKGKKYSTISGTSMATPFVAGTAALLWQAFPQSLASDIWMLLTQHALRLDLKSTDVGSGLVQAPR
jgi:subtilisin